MSNKTSLDAFGDIISEMVDQSFQIDSHKRLWDAKVDEFVMLNTAGGRKCLRVMAAAKKKGPMIGGSDVADMYVTLDGIDQYYSIVGNEWYEPANPTNIAQWKVAKDAQEKNS